MRSCGVIRAAAVTVEKSTLVNFVSVVFFVVKRRIGHCQQLVRFSFTPFDLIALLWHRLPQPQQPNTQLIPADCHVPLLWRGRCTHCMSMSEVVNVIINVGDQTLITLFLEFYTSDWLDSCYGKVWSSRFKIWHMSTRTESFKVACTFVFHLFVHLFR